MKKGQWHFEAGSEDLATMEQAEKHFRDSYEDGYTRDLTYDTKIVRRNGLWQLFSRRLDA